MEEVVHALATGQASTDAMTKQPMKVYKWDLDETLILLKSLLVGSYARDFEGLKDPECRSKRDSPSLFSHARSIMYALKEKKIDMWKFAHVTFSKPEYLQDSDIVMNRFHKQRPVYGGWEQHHGLEHTSTTQKRSYLGNNQNCHSFEKPVRIYN
uniref:protein-tyrosine-phosphatase n=1 Tax=Zea mays TaxID=4577 RepID=A0A804LPQ7_MAIZE